MALIQLLFCMLVVSPCVASSESNSNNCSVNEATFKEIGQSCGDGERGYIGICTLGSTCAVSLNYETDYIDYRKAIAECTKDEDIDDYINEPYDISSPSPSPTPDSPFTKPVKCRSKCSIEFCSDGKNRQCSANETAYERSPDREPCQHTTCWACRFLLAPQCPTCPEPVRKRCLRHFYLCLEKYFQRADILMKLHDAATYNLSTSNGTVMCHVSGVLLDLPPNEGDKERENDEENDTN